MASTAAKAIQKIRLRILPFVLLLFVVALIDRNNVGFAALTMNKELAITSQQFGLVFGIFYAGYFIYLKSRAICCCTRSELAFGSRAS